MGGPYPSWAKIAFIGMAIAALLCASSNLYLLGSGVISSAKQGLKIGQSPLPTALHHRTSSISSQRSKSWVTSSGITPSRREFSAAVPVATTLSILNGQKSARADDNAPFNVEFDIQLSEGKKQKLALEIHPEWAPLGAQQFKKLVEDGFFNECRFFRVVDGFVVQFGINGNPDINAKYRKPIKDDQVTQSNKRGTISFATSGPNSRTTQLFINLGDNTFLDRMGFSPIGVVSADGMGVVDEIFSGYGEGAPQGSGPNQMVIQRKGNDYLKKYFPRLSYVSTASVSSS